MEFVLENFFKGSFSIRVHSSGRCWRPHIRTRLISLQTRKDRRSTMSFWKKWFGKQEEKPSLDPFKDLVLDRLEPGYLVDYDMRTWEVTAHHRYDMGDGYRAEEWELRSERELRWLGREEEDGVWWSWMRKVPLGAIDAQIRSTIQKQGDPPESLEYEGTRFYMQSYGGAEFYPNGQGPPQPFLYWDYESEDGEQLLTIEQWGDDEFETSVGHYVEEYQFTNILPRQNS